MSKLVIKSDKNYNMKVVAKGEFDEIQAMAIQFVIGNCLNVGIPKKDMIKMFGEIYDIEKKEMEMNK